MYNDAIDILQSQYQIIYIILSGLGSVILFFGAFYLEIFVLKKFAPKEIGLKNYTFNGKWNIIFIIGLTIIIFFVKKLIILILSPIVSSENSTSNMMGTPNTITYVLILLFSGIIIPVAEEFFYRGFLFNAFENKSNPIVASLFSSIFFGVAHMSIIPGINAFIVGLVCCLVYYRTKSIFSPILLHSLGNLLVLIFM